MDEDEVVADFHSAKEEVDKSFDFSKNIALLNSNTDKLFFYMFINSFYPLIPLSLIARQIKNGIDVRKSTDAPKAAKRKKCAELLEEKFSKPDFEGVLFYTILEDSGFVLSDYERCFFNFVFSDIDGVTFLKVLSSVIEGLRVGDV